MKNLNLWIDSLRLSMTLPAAALVHMGFVLSGHPTNWLSVAIVFVVAVATMLQNDYDDRFHDFPKGKRLAYHNPKIFRLVLFVLWTFVIIFSAKVLTDSHFQGFLLFVCTAIGIFYSYSRQVAFLPLFLMAFTSSLPALFALRLEISAILCIGLCIAVFSIIMGREIIKDFEDKDIDKGYKKTIFTEKIMSEKMAMKWSAVLILAGLLITFLFRPSHSDFASLLYWFGAVCCLVSIIGLWAGTNSTTAKKSVLDIGIGLIVISFSLLPFLPDMKAWIFGYYTLL